MYLKCTNGICLKTIIVILFIPISYLLPTKINRNSENLYYIFKL